MRFLFDIFPVLLFFAAFKMADDPQQGVLMATAAAMLASIAQVAYMKLRHGRVERMHLVSLALITVLGGATLLLHDPVFIKWKPTAINWAFALAFLGSQFLGDKPLVHRMMGSALRLPETVWRRLNLAWSGFFVLLGAANLYVAFHFSLETWVDFKTYGMLGATVAFVVLQSIYLSRYLEPEPEGE